MPSLTPGTRTQWLSQLRADQSARWQRGERVLVEQYLTEFPVLAGDPEALLDLIHAEIIHRLQSGDRPSLDDYLRRFPAHAEAVRRWLLAASAGEDPKTTAPEVGTIGPDAAPLSVPALPGFELYEKLGEGGMGVVYRARDLRLDQPRAIKVIRAGPFAGRDAHDRFEREAKAVARLDHPGVVRIYALGEHAELLYICMEFLEGGSLKARLARGPLEVRAAAGLVRQLALAVEHAHANRVLHRDLKPANVLLAADGTPKVADFGLAKLLDSNEELTHTGAVMGTPAYMAPEQAEGRPRDINVQTDVWALGVVLYECLVGRPPFKGECRSETLDLVKTQPPVALRQLRPEVPAELEAICLKCLEKEAERRYATAADLAADLQAWLDGKAPAIRPARGLRRLARGIRRRWRLTTAAAVVLLAALVAGLLTYLKHPDRPLWQMQAQLRRGEPVELIGATGGPHWSRWRVGENNATMSVESDGTFVVNTWPLTLLELLPDTAGQRHYRIRAEVRHLRGGEHGDVGLYFAATTDRTPPVPMLSFLHVHYNDLHDAIAIFHERIPAALQRQERLKPPPGNRVILGSRYRIADLEQEAPDLSSGLAARAVFRPAGIAHAGQPGEWREVQIEVSPTVIRAWWNGQLVGELNPGAVEADANKAMQQMRQKPALQAALGGYVPHLDWQGGLGLYLYASSASFRNVHIEPVNDTGNPD
jgi:serine/threonine-protein kinase